MKLNIEIKDSKAYLNWTKIDADYYRIFCYIDENYLEYAKVYDTTFARLSLLPFGQNKCFIQAIKNGCIIDESNKITFNINILDVLPTNFKDKENIYFSKHSTAINYRLYKSSDNKDFGGIVNSRSNILNYKLEKNQYYKIKPYTSDNNNSRVILGTSSVFEKQKEFEDLSIYKSYNNKWFFSWNYQGYADGFMIFTQNSKFPVFETHDYLRHYTYLEDFQLDTNFYVVAFANTPYGKIPIAQSRLVKYSERIFERPKISLIIPAYNAKDYIARSIDSALASNFNKFEIIIVNDGSTDSTQEIIDWYTSNFMNIKSIIKTNGGVADTRNVGIKAANGEYIAFMDNDDLLRPNMLSSLYSIITETDSDVAIAPLYRMLDKGYTTHCNLPFKPYEAHNIDTYLSIMYTPNFYNCAIWNKLYKASIVKEHPLGLLKYEDVSWTPCILSYAKTFCFIPKPLYEWDRKTREMTFGDVLAKMPENELFEHRKQAMLFFVENGNPEKRAYLKEIAIRRLNRYKNNSNHNGYKELIERIETDEYLEY